jgi:glycosyltransferase involved in cell wall biosynthesis
MSPDLEKPKFSIFTPVHVWNEDRRQWLLRAIESVAHQTYSNFEHIIINDGSVLEVDIPHHPWLRLFNQTHQERIIAYNLGFREATGDWFCCLDSDDEYIPTYLEECLGFISQYPDYKMFNFGCRYVHKDGGESVREAFCPPELETGHDVFGGSNIVNGTFIWHRSVYDALGGFPDSGQEIDVPWYRKGPLFMGSPYDFSAYAQYLYPEIQQYFMVDHEAEPNKIVKELGNPWGQDYFLFFKYTRKYKSKPMLQKYLYIVHPR